jgi:hypothetical protein
MKTNKTFNFLVVSLVVFIIAACGNKKEVAMDSQSAVETTETLADKAPKLEEENRDSTFLIYQRTPCFGMCPYFNLTIYESGYCVYEGKNFVDMVGFYHTRVDMSVLQNIKETAERIQYFSLADSYDNPHVTDLPTTTTGIKNGEKMKTVAARYKSPKELQELYQVLDEMIEAATWTSMAEKKKMQN